MLVWQRAFALALEIYEVTKSFPREEQYGLVSQLRRASVSIAANIAEGYERQHQKEYRQFLSISKGSLGEVETYLLFSRELKYFSEAGFSALESRRNEVVRLLTGLMKSLSKRKL